MYFSTSTRKCSLGLFLFPILISPICLGAKPTAAIDSLIYKGITLSIQQRYAEAISLFHHIEEEFPDNPVGYFFHAAVLQTQMMDFEEYDKEQEFIELVNKALAKSKARVRRTNDAWAYFYAGGSYGYLAFYKSKRGKYWESLKHAQKSVQALQKAISIDSTLYDAYLGIGSYKYYKSKYSKYLAWLPIVTDERAIGIDLLNLAIERSKFSRFSAINGLSWILLEEKRYEEGLTLIEDALQEFPESRVFLWAAAKLCQKLNRLRTAATHYENILASFNREGIESPLNRIACHKHLCEIYTKLGQIEKAQAECEHISEISSWHPADKPIAAKLKEVAKTCAKYLPPPSTVGD